EHESDARLSRNHRARAGGVVSVAAKHHATSPRQPRSAMSQVADPFSVVSPAFKDGDVWPAKYAGADPSRATRPCGGQNVSPPLAWSNAPDATRSFAILMFDAD